MSATAARAASRASALALALLAAIAAARKREPPSRRAAGSSSRRGWSVVRVRTARRASPLDAQHRAHVQRADGAALDRRMRSRSRRASTIRQRKWSGAHAHARARGAARLATRPTRCSSAARRATATATRCGAGARWCSRTARHVPAAACIDGRGRGARIRRRRAPTCGATTPGAARARQHRARFRRASASTDEDGEFRIDGLAVPGRYRLLGVRRPQPQSLVRAGRRPACRRSTRRSRSPPRRPVASGSEARVVNPRAPGTVQGHCARLARRQHDGARACWRSSPTPTRRGGRSPTSTSEGDFDLELEPGRGAWAFRDPTATGWRRNASARAKPAQATAERRRRRRSGRRRSRTLRLDRGGCDLEAREGVMVRFRSSRCTARRTTSWSSTTARRSCPSRSRR